MLKRRLIFISQCVTDCESGTFAAIQVMLRDASERMQAKLDELQGRYAGLALSKTDLSTQLLMTEEEKLRVRNRSR